MAVEYRQHNVDYYVFVNVATCNLQTRDGLGLTPVEHHRIGDEERIICLQETLHILFHAMKVVHLGETLF